MRWSGRLRTPKVFDMMHEGTSKQPLQPDRGDDVRDDANARRRELREKRKEELDDMLERGLEDTFPGSDPVAATQPPHSARDKRR
jgi:hypothetical protein